MPKQTVLAAELIKEEEGGYSVYGAKLDIYTVKPGLWLQKTTTPESDDDQLEVAIAALKEALGKSEAQSESSR